MAHIVLDNGGLDFVKIEQQEGGIIPFGTDFANPDFAAVAEAMGAKGIGCGSLTARVMVLC